MIGIQLREKGESNNNAQGNTFTYHGKNKSISLFTIGEGSTLSPSSAGKFKSRKMKRIKLAMAQCWNQNCSRENNR